MPRSSVASVAPSPQSSSATVATRIAELRVALATKLDRVRAEMVAAAPHGFQARVAAFVGIRKERISREISSVEKLSLEIYLAEIELHREEGRGETADRLFALLSDGQPIHLRTDRALLIRMKDGQMFLDLQP